MTPESIALTSAGALYIAKTLWEQARTIREDRHGVVSQSSEKTGNGVSIRSREVLSIFSLSELIGKLAEGQVKMQEAIIHLTTVIEERLPSRRR